jgi:tetratricopeptide (TPR) repeat protein
MAKIFSSVKRRAATVLSASAIAIAAVGLIGPMTFDIAQAQEAAAEGRQFSAANGEQVSQANEALNNGSPQQAISILNNLLNGGSAMNAYERSLSYQILGSAYNDLEDYGGAQRAFQNAINAGGLLPNEADALRVNVAQLMILNGQYREGAEALERFLASGGQEKPQFTDLLVQAWVEAQDYRRALPWAEKWFNRASPKERRHFDLLNFLYNNLGMSGKQSDIIKEMIKKWPQDRDLWNSWASMLAQGGREQDAFEVQKMLYLGGAMTTEPDLKKVISYYSFYEMPFQAAQILEREMNSGRVSRTPDNLKELATYYRTAREYGRAIPILEQAAQQSNTAKLYADLGEAYYNEGQCQKSEEAFRKAIDRGYDAGKSWMQVGNCIYDSTQEAPRLDCGDYDFEAARLNPALKRDISAQIENAEVSKVRAAAVETFRRVPPGSRETRNARKWIEFIGNEKQSFINRCEFQVSVEVEQCFSAIQLAYNAQVFTGGEFELAEEKCLKYKDEYDSKYVTTTN